MPYRLQLVFQDRDDFRREFERNIVMGGAFIPTGDPLALRTFVEVAIELPFCGEVVVLDAEVVHLVPPERALSPGDVGVAVSFRKPAGELQAMFEGHLEGGDAEAGGRDPSQSPGSADGYAPGIRFDVLVDGIDAQRRSALEVSVVELALARADVAKMLEVIPEQPGDIHRTLAALVEEGVLRVRGDAAAR